RVERAGDALEEWALRRGVERVGARAHEENRVLPVPRDVATVGHPKARGLPSLERLEDRGDGEEGIGGDEAREQRRGGLRQPLAEGDRRLSEPFVRQTARRLALGPREELEPMREVELEDEALEVFGWSALEEGETLHHGG